MVRRVLGLVYKEVSGLHQAAYVLAVFAFGSQLLALVRDRILASQFGADATLDIYYAAFRIPDLLFVLFASMLSVYVLLPYVASYAERGLPEQARALLGQLMTLFLAGYILLAVVIALGAPYLLAWLYPGITDQTLLVQVTQVLLLQPVLLGLSSLCGVVTQYHSRFVLHAISPLVYNVGIIFGILVLYPYVGLVGVAVGVVLGALGHVAVQWPLVQQSQFRFLPQFQFDWPALRSVVMTALPRAFTLSLNQLTLLILISLGTAMAVGSVAVFQFAFNLQSVPLAIIGVSYSVAAFPTLARLYAGNSLAKFQQHIITALRHIIFWSVPVIALCVVLRAQLVRVILGSGAFDWEDTRLTAAVFAVLILSLVAHGINLLLVRALYAGGDTKTPLVVSLFSTVVTIGFAFWLHAQYVANLAFQSTVASTLRVSDVAGTEVLVLAVAYTAGIWLQLILFAVVAHYRFVLAWREPLRVTAHALVAALVGGGVAYGALNLLVDGLNINTFIGIFLQGVLAGVLGLAGVIIAYALLRSPELREMTSALSRRIFKTDVVASQKHVL
jgi:putative peptidoglycan lipid II flippase